ncbi:hypothetical protein [Sphingobium bisphenolivorans]|nr:hypothetical protein [Sphingobium bisphenolivorans]
MKILPLLLFAAIMIFGSVYVVNLLAEEANAAFEIVKLDHR